MSDRSVAYPMIVLVTGMSGAGRSTALAALEDLGFEAVDNLPLAFISRLAQGPNGNTASPLAIGVDIRSRDFSPDALKREIRHLVKRGISDIKTLFLDCGDDTLLKRYTETRRRHPLASDRPISDGIRKERRAISSLAESADIVIDTTSLTVWDFKQRISVLFGSDTTCGISITVMSFSFRGGIPREADIVLDVRFLKNPHYNPELRPLTGRDPAVGAAIRDDPDFSGYLSDLQALLTRTLPRHEAEGKSYLTIAIGCTGGKHRSVYMAEQLTGWLKDAGHSVHIVHRDIPDEG